MHFENPKFDLIHQNVMRERRQEPSTPRRRRRRRIRGIVYTITLLLSPAVLIPFAHSRPPAIRLATPHPMNQNDRGIMDDPELWWWTPHLNEDADVCFGTAQHPCASDDEPLDTYWERITRSRQT